MAHFVIDGNQYEVPEVDSLTMGEAVTVYDYTGLGLDEINEGVRHPGVMAAFLHIAYKRGNPGTDDKTVKELVSNTRLVDALEKIEVEDDAGPPDLTTKPSRKSSGGKPKSSGGGSSTSSDEPDATPEPTGTSE